MEWKLFATEDAVSLSADKESLIIDDPDRPGSMYKARNSDKHKKSMKLARPCQLVLPFFS